MRKLQRFDKPLHQVDKSLRVEKINELRKNIAEKTKKSINDRYLMEFQIQPFVNLLQSNTMKRIFTKIFNKKNRTNFKNIEKYKIIILLSNKIYTTPKVLAISVFSNIFKNYES